MFKRLISNIGLGLLTLVSHYATADWQSQQVFEVRESTTYKAALVKLQKGEKLYLAHVDSENGDKVYTFRIADQNGENVKESFSIPASRFEDQLIPFLMQSRIKPNSTLEKVATEDAKRLDKIMSFTFRDHPDIAPRREAGLFFTSGKETFVGVSTSVGFHKACSAFMNESGQLGDYGLLYVNNIINNHADEYLSNAALARDMSEPGICPNFPKMTKNQRLHFWAYFAASKAMAESRCGQDVYGSNGANTPTGMMQIAASPNEVQGYGCGRFSPTADKANITCSQKILASQFRRFNMLVTCQSYFAPLRPNGGFDGRYSCSSRTDGWQMKMAGFLRAYAPCYSSVSAPSV